MIKLKHVKRDSKNYKKSLNDEGGTDSGSVEESSSDESDEKNLITAKIGNLFSNMLNLKKEMRLTSKSFKSDTVWSKLIEHADSDWKTKINERYLNDLLSKFDPENLMFRINSSQSFRNNSKRSENLRKIAAEQANKR